MDSPPQDNSGKRSVPSRLLRAARIAVLVQALAMLVVIGLTIPSFLDYLFHPIRCTGGELCLDLRGLSFVGSVAFLGLPALLLLATYWLWRRPRRSPAVLPLLIDVAAIAVVTVDLIEFARTGSAEPNILVQLLVVLLPAIISLTLVLELLSRWNSKEPTPGAVASSH
ncbi:MAG TPA: hypothetical protein VGU71_19435 [Candidatus Dormibacteraeota bacterium]|nr:hypothetical protein [Candidatus Dormibacteraeota bacterium]